MVSITSICSAALAQPVLSVNVARLAAVGRSGPGETPMGM
jgi:hypothetical protein